MIFTTHTDYFTVLHALSLFIVIAVSREFMVTCCVCRHVPRGSIHILFRHQHQLPTRTAKGQMYTKGKYFMSTTRGFDRMSDCWLLPVSAALLDLPSKRRPRRQCVLEHPTRGLEASAQSQQRHGWPAILVPRTQCGRSAQ